MYVRCSLRQDKLVWKYLWLCRKESLNELQTITGLGSVFVVKSNSQGFLEEGQV